MLEQLDGLEEGVRVVEVENWSGPFDIQMTKPQRGEAGSGSTR